MSKPKTKRFYKSVSVNEVKTGWGIYLDDHLLKTPGKLSLIAQTKAHADLIASEWDAQDTIIKPHLMPVTRLYNVALERTPENRDALIAEVQKYAGTDLLCYRTEFPHGLAERQAAAWDSWLDWARGLGIDLEAVIGINAVEQPSEALRAVAKFAGEFDDLKLTLLAHLNAVYGSAILALAVVKGELPADKAYDLSRIDFEFQAERWGEDEEARELSEVTRNEVIALSKLL